MNSILSTLMDYIRFARAPEAFILRRNVEGVPGEARPVRRVRMVAA